MEPAKSGRDDTEAAPGAGSGGPLPASLRLLHTLSTSGVGPIAAHAPRGCLNPTTVAERSPDFLPGACKAGQAALVYGPFGRVPGSTQYELPDGCAWTRAAQRLNMFVSVHSAEVAP